MEKDFHDKYVDFLLRYIMLTENNRNKEINQYASLLRDFIALLNHLQTFFSNKLQYHI